MNKVSKCKYKKEYTDFISKMPKKKYECDEDAVKDGYCIFHHPEYWKENEEYVRGEFMKKVENAINNEKELLCIGYNLPKIDLSYKKFKAPVYFTDAVFHEGAKFYKAEFSEADFSEARFFSEANFDEAKFSKAYFINTKFFKFSKVYFIDTTFSEAYFGGAKFSKSSEAYFGGTRFFSEVNFNGAKFSKVYFTKAVFSKAYFSGAVFSKEVNFNETQFLGITTFTGSTFLGRALFEYSDFSPGLLANRLDPYSIVFFKETKFEKPEEVVFDSCNMERVSFINTNIERVKFRNVKWRDNYKIYDEEQFLLKFSEEEREKFIENEKRKLKKILDVLDGKKIDDEIEEEIEKALKLRIPDIMMKIWLLKEKIKILENAREEIGYRSTILKRLDDELNKIYKVYNEEKEKIKNELNEIIKKSTKEIQEYILKKLEDVHLNLENVLAVYRALRENYDYYLKYDESGKFFINEMNLKKSFSNPLEKSVMTIYELFCLYGESFIRTLVWIIVVISIFAILRTLPDLNFLDSLKTSTVTFFQLYYDNRWLTILERLISIPLLGSLYIALRRKLERRVRH